MVVPAVQQEMYWRRVEKSETVAPAATEESRQTVRSLSCLAPPRRMAACALLRSRARRSAWVACARLWTLYKAATSARAPTAAAKLRQAPATARRCPTENALLIPPRRVGLAAGRPAVLQRGRAVALPAGRPVALPAGRPVALPAGRPVALPAGRPVALPAGRPVALPAGRSVAQRAGWASAALERQVPLRPRPRSAVSPAPQRA